MAREKRTAHIAAKQQGCLGVCRTPICRCFAHMRPRLPNDRSLTETKDASEGSMQHENHAARAHLPPQPQQLLVLTPVHGRCPRRVQQQPRQRQGLSRTIGAVSLTAWRCCDFTSLRSGVCRLFTVRRLNRQKAALLDLIVAPYGPWCLHPKLWFLYRAAPSVGPPSATLNRLSKPSCSDELSLQPWLADKTHLCPSAAAAAAAAAASMESGL